MKIKTDSLKLQALFNTLKESISKTNDRPVLKYIKMKVSGNELTAVALDGYILSSFKTEIVNEDNQDFEFLIQPFYIPKTRLPSEITFEKNDKIVNVTINQFTKDKICYSFQNLMDATSFIDWEKVIPETDEKLEICFDAVKMINVLKQFTKFHDCSNNNVVMSFVRKDNGINPVQAICLKQKTGIGIDKQAIILPIRRLTD